MGRAIADIVAESVHKVIVSVLPHHHMHRIKVTMDAIREADNQAKELLAPMAQHALDTGAVHPVLVPLFEMMAGHK